MTDQVGLKRKEKIQEAIAKMCLLNNNLMTLVFDKNVEATELILNIILQRNDLKVMEVVAQRGYKNPMAGQSGMVGTSIKVHRTDTFE